MKGVAKMTANEDPTQEPNLSVPDSYSGKFNLKNIRDLLTKGFSEEELLSFCFDDPKFQEVYYNRLGRRMGKGEIIGILIEYATQRKCIEDLLAFAKENNSSRYEQYLPYYIGPTESLPPLIASSSLPGTDDTCAKNNAVLWRLAYAFLRLEQLPSGGWARSLPQWYQTLQSDTEESRSRGFELRKIGDMNLTCIALLNYTRWLCSVLGKKPEDYLNMQQDSAELKLFLRELGQIEKRNRVGEHAIGHIQGRINTEGAIPDQWDRNPDTDIHDTLLGIIGLLLAYFLSGSNCEPTFYDSLVHMYEYLDGRGQNVILKADNRRYKIYCALKFLEHLLTYNFFKTTDDSAQAVLDKLPNILGKIRLGVSTGGSSKAYPNVDGDIEGFLLNLPFLWNLSGFEPIETNSNFMVWPLRRISIVDDLVQYTHGKNSVSDWGYTAEYWWANTRCEASGTNITETNRQILFTQLTNGSVFLLTHGISFSSVLGICTPPTRQALEDIDKQVKDVLNSGATERNILSLILWIYNQEYPDVRPLSKNLGNDREILRGFPNSQKLLQIISEIKNLFVNKLQPGFYITPAIKVEITKSEGTKEFFNDILSDDNTAANEKRLPEKKWFHLSNYLENKPVEPGLWILDVGCGSGAHAIHQFLPQGYRVHFYDCSQRILHQLKIRLDEKGFSPDQYELIPGNIEDLPTHKVSPLVKKFKYKMIFADGVLFHIPKEQIPDILICFFDMLCDDGLLFANFKINDHTLIGIDGRRFEYYANHDEIQGMIERAEFHVNEVTLTRKETSMYHSPYPTQWAHFICTKKAKRQDG